MQAPWKETGPSELSHQDKREAEDAGGNAVWNFGDNLQVDIVERCVRARAVRYIDVLKCQGDGSSDRGSESEGFKHPVCRRRFRVIPGSARGKCGREIAKAPSVKDDV